MESPEKGNFQHSSLENFRSFIQYHQIEASQIWGNKQKLVLSEFLTRVQNIIGLKLSVREASSLLALSQNPDQSLEIKHFQPYGLWVGQSNMAKSQHRCIIDRMQENSLSQKIQEPDDLEYSPKKRTSGKKSNILIENEDKLYEQITQNCLDKKWEYLLKVGEMNNWLLSSNSNKSGLFSKQSNRGPEPEMILEPALYQICEDQNDIIIIKSNEQGEEEVLPLKVFDQKYYSCAKKFAECEKSKNNMKGTMIMVLDGKQRFCKSKVQEKVALRDQQLNYLLLEIIRVKNMLEQQEKILIECQVNV